MSYSASPTQSMLLLTLREVSDLVSNSHDLSETLSNICHLIQRRFQTDVCSVYTMEEQANELVLRATVGLRQEAVGTIRMQLHEGLVGLVAQQRSHVSVEDAPTHPRYRFFPESGEDRYRSFLGVPLIQGGAVEGVLVVQHKEPRRYTANEVRLLVGVAAQLAILVTNARLTRDLAAVVRRESEPNSEKRRRTVITEFHGTSSSPGCGMGTAIRFEEFDFNNPDLVKREPGLVEHERARLQVALDRAKEDLEHAAEYLAELLGEQFGALMQAQRLMLEDSSVQNDLVRMVERGLTVERAVVTACEQYLRAFQKLKNPFFYERIYDIKDVFRRVLSHATEESLPTETAESVIVIAHEVSLLELFACDLRRVKGIAVEKGGVHSHVAILARSLGIPMLTHVHGLLASVETGAEVFIDSASGMLIVDPDPARRKALEKLIADNAAYVDEPIGNVPSPLRIEATVNLLPELGLTISRGGDGVGLYRSELLELACRTFPTEEEQLETYRKMISILAGKPLTIRTLDLRPAKLFGITSDPMFERETWDWRLVAELPHVQSLLRSQLRAALRASLDGPIRLLFPMIVSDRQLKCALQLVDQARRSLEQEGVFLEKKVPVGIMIEVPAAAMLCKQWINLVDFVSVGSNDLLHSLLGIQREDNQLDGLRTPLDPVYLTTVSQIVRHAHRAGRTVTVCGEAIDHEIALLALYTLGVDAVSLPPNDIPRARKLFHSVELPLDPRAVARRLVKCQNPDEVDEILREAFPKKTASVSGTPLVTS
ncbi:GAF domain-containing protein [bacterium]|nr:GAF domain-containing protein [bacterium]